MGASWLPEDSNPALVNAAFPLERDGARQTKRISDALSYQKKLPRGGGKERQLLLPWPELVTGVRADTLFMASNYSRRSQESQQEQQRRELSNCSCTHNLLREIAISLPATIRWNPP